MALFQFYWLRRLIRRHMNPIPMRKAQVWQKRLSFLYFFFAWNGIGFIGYQYYLGRGDWAKEAGLKDKRELAMTPGESFATLFKVQKAKIVRVGFGKPLTESDFLLEEHLDPEEMAAMKIVNEDDDADEDEEGDD